MAYSDGDHADQSAWYWNRWSQLVLGLIAMMAISSPQYVWTLFTGPLNQKLGTTLAELQWTFSLLIILQTWCSPLQAYLVDRFGPRLLISVGRIAVGWRLGVVSLCRVVSGRSISPMASSAASAPASFTLASSG